MFSDEDRRIQAIATSGDKEIPELIDVPKPRLKPMEGEALVRILRVGVDETDPIRPYEWFLLTSCIDSFERAFHNDTSVIETAMEFSQL